MSKLNRRDFLKQISIMPFMAIPLIENLGIDESSDTEFIEAYTDENGQVVDWNIAKSSEVDKNVSYIGVTTGENPVYFRIC